MGNRSCCLLLLSNRKRLWERKGSETYLSSTLAGEDEAEVGSIWLELTVDSIVVRPRHSIYCRRSICRESGRAGSGRCSLYVYRRWDPPRLTGAMMPAFLFLPALPCLFVLLSYSFSSYFSILIRSDWTRLGSDAIRPRRRCIMLGYLKVVSIVVGGC